MSYGSAYCHNEINIRDKFTENRSKGSLDIEQTSSSKGKTHDIGLWP